MFCYFIVVGIIINIVTVIFVVANVISIVGIIIIDIFYCCSYYCDYV